MELEELVKSNFIKHEEGRNMSSPPHLNPSFTHISFAQFLLSVVSVGVNLMVLMSAWWCKRPIPPGLFLNFSLVFANLLIGILISVDLLLDDAMPALFQHDGSDFCSAVNLRIMFQGCNLISALHFPAIQSNAWMALAKTNYTSLMTFGTVRKHVCIIWVVVILGTFSYFCLYGVLTVKEECKGFQALQGLFWKIIYFLCCFICLITTLMFYFYFQQLVKNRIRTTARYQSPGTPTKRRYYKLNITCVLLLLTFIIGILPESLWNLLFCKECLLNDSHIHGTMQTYTHLILRTISVLKTLAIPIIFATQISDVEVSLGKMTCGLLSRACSSCVSRGRPLIDV